MNASQGFGFEANNGSVSVPDLASAINIIDAQKAEIDRLFKGANDFMDTNRQLLQEIEVLKASFRSKAEKLADAKQHLTAYLDEDDIDVEEGSDLEALCAVLDVERTQYVDILVTATWRVSATIPSKYDPQEWANEHDWSVDLDDAGLDSVGFPTIETDTY